MILIADVDILFESEPYKQKLVISDMSKFGYTLKFFSIILFACWMSSILRFSKV